jgi:pimeloyl-ACP methyl ester carboxylesterase
VTCEVNAMRQPAVLGNRRYAVGAALTAAVLVLATILAGPPARSEVPSMPTPQTADYLALEGGRLYYEVFGAGFPIVLIHDGLAHSPVWDAQVAAFAPHYRVIRYDRRGYGRSDPPDTTYSNLDDLHALLQALGVARAIVVGSSAGGGLAIDFALAYPTMVEALVLSGPVVNGLGYSFHFMQRAYANFARDPQATAELWINDPYGIAPGNDAARARLREILTASPQNLDFAKGRYERSPESAALPRLGQITAPTLLLVGDRDIPDVHAHVGAIEAGIRGARRVVIPGAGHLVYLEQPAAFNHEVSEFLSLLTLAPGSPRLARDPAAPWDGFRRGFAPVDGTALYYEEMGAGDPVVLIHGGTVDHRMWDAQFAALAADHRVVRYDVRGQGLSLSPYGTYRHSEDLVALLEHLRLPRAHLIGLSLGSRIAADLAIEHPERVASLVLASPGVSGYDFSAPEEQAFNQRIGAAWMAGDFALAAEEFVRGWCDGPQRTPEQTPPGVRENVKAMALANLRPGRDGGSGVELDPPAVGRLGEIRAPTLAILGERDMPGIHAIVGMIGEQVPGARVERFPRAAHMVNLEEPAEFERIVGAFLKTQRDGGR